MIQLGAKISPYRDPVARLPPGRKRQTEHVQRSQRRSRAHPKPEQEADSDEQLQGSDHICEKHWVRLN